MSVPSWCQCGPEAAPERDQLLFEHPAIGELEQADAAVGGAGDHRSQGRIEPGEANAASFPGAPRRQAERLLERLAKAAVRLVAGLEHGIVQRSTMPDPLECLGQPARPAIGLERESVARREITAHARRFHAHRAQITLTDAGVGAPLHVLEQAIDPRWRRVSLERPAAEAWTVAGEQRVLRNREELDVLRLRLSRRARWPAEDAGGADAKIEDAVVRRVGSLIGTFHLLAARQRNMRKRRADGGRGCRRHATIMLRA